MKQTNTIGNTTPKRSALCSIGRENGINTIRTSFVSSFPHSCMANLYNLREVYLTYYLSKLTKKSKNISKF